MTFHYREIIFRMRKSLAFLPNFSKGCQENPLIPFWSDVVYLKVYLLTFYNLTAFFDINFLQFHISNTREKCCLKLKNRLGYIGYIDFLLSNKYSLMASLFNVLSKKVISNDFHQSVPTFWRFYALMVLCSKQAILKGNTKHFQGVL